MTKEEAQRESLERAQNGQSLANWQAIFDGFMEKGIEEDDILPRENVFTYNAWRALGRQVRRGEKGVKIVTFVPIKGKKDEEMVKDGESEKRGRMVAKTTTVFHVSQTDPIDAVQPVEEKTTEPAQTNASGGWYAKFKEVKEYEE